jgi:dihydroflavonol-4-reductase
LVTGGTGFLGSRICRRLRSEGIDCRPTCRTEGDLARDPSAIVADLSRKAEVERIEGDYRFVVHAAASVELTRTRSSFLPDNVIATRNILDFCKERKVKGIIHVSTKGTRHRRGERLNNEDSRFDIACEDGYLDSKREAESILTSQDDVPVSVLLPTAIVGPGDHKPTPTGQFLLDYCRRRIPAYFPGGLNLVHVDDVSLAVLRVLELERFDGSFILGGENLSMDEFLGLLQQTTGIPKPRVRIPLSVAKLVGRVSEAKAGLTGTPPRTTFSKVSILGEGYKSDSSKATRDLRIQFRSAREAIADSYAWYKQERYL